MALGRIGLHKSEELQSTDNTTIKCSQCFSRQVKHVCHHCGKYLCEKCEPKPIVWLRRLRLYKHLFKDYEFFELHEFKREFRLSAHCQEHVHYIETIYHLLIWMIVGIGVVGAILSWLLGLERSVLIGFGGLAAVALTVLLPTRGRIYRFLFTNQPHPHLFFPTKYKVDITESVIANFRVDETMENYLDVGSTLDGISGKLLVSLSPIPGNYEHQKKLATAKNCNTINFSAGYLGLDNLEQVKFNQGDPIIKFKDETVGKGANKIDHQGKLHLSGILPVSIFEQVYQDQAAIEIEQLYEIREKAGWVGPRYDQEFPFWIIPNLSLAGRELIILICVTPEIQGKFNLEHLSLTLPDKVVKGGVEIHGLLNRTENEFYSGKHQLQVGGKNPFSLKLGVPLPHDVEISGKYKISVDDFLLSGLKMESQGHLWFANGEPVPEPGSKGDEENWLEKVSQKTQFAGTFNFNTSALKVQREFTTSDADEQRHCCPNHELISEIVDILTQQNVEIKSIVETPARIGDFRDGARLWDRYWGIEGRYYLEAELQYVEVHVVVYGQENRALLFEQKLMGGQSVPEQAFTDTQDTSNMSEKVNKQEFVRWQLHLRSEIPVHSEELADRLKQLCKERLGTKIREKLAKLALSVE